MDDVFGKIGELLSDEESVKQLSELAQMFMGEASSEAYNNGSAEDGESGAQNESVSPFGSFDLGALMKIQSLMGAMNQPDKNSELLLALKPHLKEEKREKVDKAVKLLKIIAVWNVIKDSGLLKDLF